VKWKVVGGKDELAKTKTKKGMADETASIVDSSCGNVKSWNAQPPQHCNQQDEDIFKMDVVTISTATEQLKCADLPVPMEVDEPTQQMTFMNNLQSIGPRLSVSKTMPGSFPDVIGDNGPTTLSSISLNQPPQGLKWSNNSCAYDALLTVLYRSFTSDLRSWDKYKDPTTHIMFDLYQGFFDVLRSERLLENVRDTLSIVIPDQSLGTVKPRGQFNSPIDIFQILRSFSFPDLELPKVLFCGNCNSRQQSHRGNTPQCTSLFVLSPSSWAAFQSTGRNMGHISQSDTATWLNMFMVCKSYAPTSCSTCQTRLIKNRDHQRTPLLICFDLANLPGPITLSKQVYLPEQQPSMRRVKYRLCGVIYFGESHFVCRVIDRDGTVWSHDGMWLSPYCRLQGPLKDFDSQKMWWIRNSNSRKKAHVAIYTIVE
jgi:hypothetical protein